MRTVSCTGTCCSYRALLNAEQEAAGQGATARLATDCARCMRPCRGCTVPPCMHTSLHRPCLPSPRPPTGAYWPAARQGRVEDAYRPGERPCVAFAHVPELAAVLLPHMGTIRSSPVPISAWVEGQAPALQALPLCSPRLFCLLLLLLCRCRRGRTSARRRSER